MILERKPSTASPPVIAVLGLRELLRDNFLLDLELNVRIHLTEIFTKVCNGRNELTYEEFRALLD